MTVQQTIDLLSALNGSYGGVPIVFMQSGSSSLNYIQKVCDATLYEDAAAVTGGANKYRWAVLGVTDGGIDNLTVSTLLAILQQFVQSPANPITGARAMPSSSKVMMYYNNILYELVNLSVIALQDATPTATDYVMLNYKTY